MTKIKKIILFLIAFIVAALYMEVYLRWSGLSNPSYVYDDNEVGRTHNKGYDIIITGAEGFCIDKVNKYGYVGKPYPKERNNNAIRIGLLGSSYVEGLQVFRRNRFSTILEQNLTKELNRKVEVLNFAIAGDDFRGMYTRYEKLVKNYHPDYVLYIIQSESLLKKKSIPSPDLVLKDDSLVFNYDFLNSAESTMRHKFRLLREFGLGNMIKEAFEVYYTGRLPEVALDEFYMPLTKNKTKKKSGDPYKYYALNSKIIESLYKENKNSGIKNMIVEVDQIPAHYSQLLDSLNFPRILLFKDLDRYDQKDLLFWRASGMLGHWNNFAHRVVGESLAKKLTTIVTNDYNTNSSKTDKKNKQKKN